MKNLLFIFGFLLSFVSYSQSLDYNNSFESINICTAIQGNNFASERAADSALDDILNVIGASKRFVLKECSNINNAVALTMNGVRYIMYDPEFMTSLSYGDEWSNKFILAHEVGHHINGHTVDVLAANSSNKVSLSTRRIQELESDEFAGFVLGRLGASLSDALSGVQSLSNKDDSYSTHPRRSKRIAAIKKGFKESGGYVNPSSVSVKKGKTVDSKYSNSRYAGVEHRTLNNYYSDGVYVGYVSINSGDPFGYGIMYMDSGSKYEGEMSGGLRNGYGKYTWPGGNKSEGYFVNNKFTGNGITSFSKGGKNIGNFVDGKLTGKGEMHFPDGTIYKGFFEKGTAVEITVSQKGESAYKLGFSNETSLPTGTATFIDVNGYKYEGTFVNGSVKVERFPMKSIKSLSKKKRQIGLDRFIPNLIVDYFDIDVDDYWKSFGLLKKTYTDGRTFAGFFKTNTEGIIHTFERFGYGIMMIPNNFDWPEGETKWDKFIGVYWKDLANGYGAMYYKGEIIEQGIYKNGELIKSEEFDIELMTKTIYKFFENHE